MGLKITAARDCSHEIRRRLLLGRKAKTNLDNVEKQRHYSADRDPYSQGHGLLSGHVQLYSCESWTVKKTEHQRIDTFELWCWRRLLKVPWTARRSNQLVLREINSEYSLEGFVLKLQYFGHMMQTVDSLEKSLMLGRLRAGEEGIRG